MHLLAAAGRSPLAGGRWLLPLPATALPLLLVLLPPPPLRPRPPPPPRPPPLRLLKKLMAVITMMVVVVVVVVIVFVVGRHDDVKQNNQEQHAIIEFEHLGLIRNLANLAKPTLGRPSSRTKDSAPILDASPC